MWTYNNYTYPDELYHHGVPGQKWGIRRKLSTLHQNHIAKKTAKAQLKAEKDKKKQDPRDAYRSLSDEDLSKAVNRMQTEKRYRDLYNDLNPKKVSVGKKFVKGATEILSAAASQVATQAAKDMMTKGLNKVTSSNSTASAAKGMAKESSGAAKDFAKGMKETTSKSKTTSKSTTTSKSESPLHGTVEGKGTSKYKPNNGPTVNATYRDVGRDFVSNYLSLPGPVEKKKY